MSASRIVFLDRATIHAHFRAPAFPHAWINHDATAPDQLLERLAGARIAIVNKVRLEAETLARLPDLRLVAIAATGVDNVDLAACEALGIAVTNVRGYARQSVSEHVLMLMLALCRQLPAYRADVQHGAWSRANRFCLIDHPVRDLHGQTLGLVGYGAIAHGVETLARAFGMHVLKSERPGASQIRPDRLPFEAVLRQADILSLHCPLTPETRGMIGRRELQAMRPHALLINTARGALIDEQALIEALDRGWIAGAGLDVLSSEPPRADHPLLAQTRPNLIVTPHMAWSSETAMQTVADQVVEAIEAFEAGRAFNRVV